MPEVVSLHIDTPVIAGKYEIIKRLAIGGMAEVFLATHHGIDGFEKLVVLKRILPHLAREPEYVRMFLDEARTVADLQHANIVTTFEVGEEKGIYYIVMEYLQGQNLRSVFKEWQGNPRPEYRTLASGIVMDVCAGLHYAHTKHSLSGEALNIVHRDISPQNILVTYEGVPKILDFGIAQAAHQTYQTKSGVLKGKCCYMSPEHVLGRVVDRRSDVFSLGIILYELSTFNRLFSKQNEALTCRAILDSNIPRPTTTCADYPLQLERIVMKALAAKVGDRFSTADELRAALEEFHRNIKRSSSTQEAGAMLRQLFKAELEGQVRLPNRPARGESERAVFLSIKRRIRAQISAKPDPAIISVQAAQVELHSRNVIVAILGGVIGVILVTILLKVSASRQLTRRPFTQHALAIDFEEFRRVNKLPDKKSK